ncbi:uncharacterized protein LOC105736538 isoform X3 [Apis florea]|uniref:uncharacterized protein LOC105736538 isoform X3 n=1 Tax=Apis florea TaxID=7463 RepID=UPI00062940E7|nr:uncharacterized protein LOC105736538 isoform X3 [Apis florea]
MMISYDRIFCDYNVVLKSTLKKERFRRQGIRTLRKIGKYQIYEILDEPLTTEVLTSLEYKYPLLGRYNEIEFFKDLLDEIGLSERPYSGLVIEGNERSGKSRILDAYSTIVKSRQIKLIQLPLHPSFAEKSYSVLYHILLQMFDAETCITINDREKVLIKYLSEIVEPEDLCYLNYVMRVQFPQTSTFREETDWQRYKKMIDIFEKIINEIVGYVCILLDDVQYMDLFSWQFLSSILSNKHIVVAMTMLEPVSWDVLTQIETGISQEKRLKIKSLNSLNGEYLTAFACQFLNVIGIPETLERILSQHSKNGIGWCEAFLISILQVKALEIISISPKEVKKYNLVFPNPSYLSKIPVYLTPEELAPPLQWMQMTTLNVCVPSRKSKSIVEVNRDVIGDFELENRYI